MSLWFLGAALVLASGGAIAVVAFESPTRNAGGLVTAFVGVAAACGALGLELLPGLVLWIGAGGVGLFLLTAVLLLNLGADERGVRRVRLRLTLVLPPLALLWAALAAPLMEAVERPAPALNGGASLHAVAGDAAVPLAAAVIAVAAAMVVAVALVRRRA